MCIRDSLCSYLLHSILYYLSCDYRHHPNDRQVIHADVSRNDRHVCNGQDQSNGYLLSLIHILLGVDAPFENAGIVDSYGVELGLNYTKRLGDVVFNLGGSFAEGCLLYLLYL